MNLQIQADGRHIATTNDLDHAACLAESFFMKNTCKEVRIVDDAMRPVDGEFREGKAHFKRSRDGGKPFIWASVQC